MRRAVSVVFGLVLAAAIIGQSNPSAVPQLLLKAIQKADNLRFTGTRVVEFRRGPDTDRHEEYMIRDGNKLRIEFPDGSKFAGQIIVDDGNQRRQYFPDRNEIRILPSRRDDGADRLSRLIKKRGVEDLEFRAGPKMAVAGYSTQLVSVLDAYGNVTQKLYIEPKSGAVLKKVLLDRGGAPWGRFEFTKINLSPRIDPRTFTLTRKGARIVTPLDDVREAVSSGAFIFRTLPTQTGYRLEFARVIKPERKPVLMQVYTSRGHRLSLFQLGTAVDPDRMNRMGRGRETAYSWQEDGRWFVLVGSMTQDELERLSKTLSDRP